MENSGQRDGKNPSRDFNLLFMPSLSKMFTPKYILNSYQTQSQRLVASPCEEAAKTLVLYKSYKELSETVYVWRN